MADPISFPSTTLNAGLPLLFSGQAQKEFFINQSLGVIDALLPKAIEGILNDPPSQADEGHCYVIGSSPTEDWTDRTDEIAIQIGGAWHYVAPSEGQEVYDRQTQQKIIYRSGWVRPAAPAAPANGSVVDAEARASLVELVTTLQEAGIVK